MNANSSSLADNKVRASPPLLEQQQPSMGVLPQVLPAQEEQGGQVRGDVLAGQEAVLPADELQGRHAPAIPSEEPGTLRPTSFVVIVSPLSGVLCIVRPSLLSS